MAKADPRMKNCPWLIPYLTVQSAEKTLEFYEKAFGFERGTCIPGPDGKIMHGEVNYQGQTLVMFSPEGNMGCPAKAPASTAHMPPFNLYVYTHDVDALYLRAVRAGAEALQPPSDMFWGDRMARFRDLNGYQWTFATNVRDFDPAAAACK